MAGLGKTNQPLLLLVGFEFVHSALHSLGKQNEMRGSTGGHSEGMTHPCRGIQITRL